MYLQQIFFYEFFYLENPKSTRYENEKSLKGEIS